ncbi:MAG: XRE family transcriptional regulator [Mesorhizobium sp.]|uniref:helix-turn-helix domain-containing protein n=1 Tax=Mesorhizobium sp. TaxID=1871066 RepID=UPI000FE645A8|nr:helix-turn-helix transcriptional regulator [Mesorhizobium sp.]RWO34765.1 MAG: XRE family transcriptional regulator [Mesorhizobium sp.]
MPTLAENLKRIREAVRPRLSQSKLAKLAGVSQQLISQIENGENTTTKELPKLAKALHVGIAELDENFVPTAATDDEEDVLARYRIASKRRKELVRELLHELAPGDEVPE